MRSPRTIAIVLAVSAVAAVAVALALSGGRDDGGALPSPAPTTASPSPAGSPTFAYTAPLTGVGTDDEQVEQRPALAVKIENSAKARPQSGLEHADVVFEELTEGGITRFIAIFQSQVPDAVGPVRSGRLVDVGVVPAYRGVLVISGARDDVLAAIRRTGTPMLVDDAGPVFYRESSRSAPSNLYSTGEALFAAAADLADPPRRSWLFDEEPPDGHSTCPETDADAGGSEASEPPVCEDPGLSLAVQMSRVSLTGWDYDAAAGRYRRSQDGQPHTVTGSGRIGAANVLALATTVGPGPCCDPAGNPMTATRVTGEGEGVLLRDGLRYEITWSKPSATAHFAVQGPDGRPMRFKPGPTWVMLAPSSGVPSVG